jgi:hypothetical protein
MIGKTTGPGALTWVGKLTNGMREPAMEHLVRARPGAGGGGVRILL